MALILFFLLLTALLASAEVIVPGGIFALLAFGTLLTASILGYLEYGLWEAVAVFVGGFAVTLVLVYIAYRLLGKTSLRGKFILGSSSDGHTEAAPTTDSILGQSGQSLTTMSPTGMIEVNGQSYEGLSRSGLISRNEPIRVVGRDSFRLVVEKIPPSTQS